MLRDGRKAFTPLKSVEFQLISLSGRRANTFHLTGPHDGTYALSGDFYGDGKTTTITLVRSDQATVTTVVQASGRRMVRGYTNVSDSLPVSGGSRAYPVPLDATHLSIRVEKDNVRVYYARRALFKGYAHGYLALSR